MPEIDSFIRDFPTAKRVTTFEEEVREVVAAALAHQARLRPVAPGHSFPFCMVLQFSTAVPFAPFIINREHKETIAAEADTIDEAREKATFAAQFAAFASKATSWAVHDGA